MAYFYIELSKLGVNIKCFDVGGGVGVDYEGTRSQSDCSVNYGLNEYANNIFGPLEMLVKNMVWNIQR
ncbi:SpeA protein [Candidatus Pantoea carbekii]|uniref:SpeA protein n=1 Tax=Candidatus Pantoea carbekii TaxID=1235990 RepID=U3U5Y6_9GAMM|nr:SpeA protein [Candidatus Pantoea carbekii]